MPQCHSLAEIVAVLNVDLHRQLADLRRSLHAQGFYPAELEQALTVAETVARAGHARLLEEIRATLAYDRMGTQPGDQVQ